MIVKLIDLLLLAIKKIDEDGTKCRAIVTLNGETYEYGWLPFKRPPKTKINKNILQIRIDKMSSSLGDWLSYLTFSFQVDDEEETIDSLLEVIGLFLSDGLKIHLDEQEQTL